MDEKRQYPGIDLFRVAAAFLVVAIHTSPLASFSPWGDWVLTRVIARAAVPFFFMTSGFFLFPSGLVDTQRLIAFFKRTACVYALAVCLYLPVRLYNGSLRISVLLVDFLKDILWNGTFYHLWYLPASLLGAGIAAWTIRRLGLRGALWVSGFLYLIGLMGDSYYGVAQRFVWTSRLYAGLFQAMDYTRNGPFFAPLFLVLGAFAARRGPRLPLKISLTGFGVSFALMLSEALLLHRFRWQRHDSMYLFLPLLTVFLFSAAAHFRGRRFRAARSFSLALYLLHPMAILAVRFGAKMLHLWELLVQNSLIHFVAVCGVGALLSAAVVALLTRYGRGEPGTPRAELRIDLKCLQENAQVLQKALPPQCALMAVVKADAYGHGAPAVAMCLNQIGVRAFAVATADEGIALRRRGVIGEILVLGYTDPSRAGTLRRYDLTQTLIDFPYAERLNGQGCRVKVQIKVDTGMHRLGFPVQNVDEIQAVFTMKHIRVRGIYTHLCVSDSLDQADQAFTQVQAARFDGLLKRLKEQGIALPDTHVQSSYGLMNHPELSYRCVRVGLALYGALGRQTRLHLDLKPALSLRSSVILLRNVRAGETVGYGRAFTALRDSVLAVVPVGYADGYPRSLSCGHGYVLIHGEKAAIAGNICMDQMIVDVTGIENVRVGTQVTLIGREGSQEISAAALAAAAGTIPNELLSRLGRRLTVVYES